VNSAPRRVSHHEREKETGQYEFKKNMHVMLHTYSFLNLVQEQKPSGPIKCKKSNSLSNYHLHKYSTP